MHRLTLFNEGNTQDKRPLPMVIAARFDFPLQWHDVDETEYYAVQDWLRGVMQKDDVRSDWKHMQERANELLNGLQQLPYAHPNGRVYKMAFADAETLYRITQRVGVSTGIRDAVLNYLAKAGVKLDEYRLDPSQAIDDVTNAYAAQGKDAAWIEARISGVMSRKAFTATLTQLCPELNIGYATNTVYRGVFNRDTDALKRDLGLGKRDNVRDHMHRVGLHLLGVVESAVDELFRNSDSIPTEQAVKHLIKISAMFGRQADEIQQMLGIDIATGRPLLGNG